MLSPSLRPLCAVLAGASLCALALPAGADPAPSFPELLRQAEDAPRLREARAGVAQAQGALEQSTVRPNPAVNFQVENFGGNGAYRGGDHAETTASIEQTIELGGKRAARRAVGEAGVDTARARAVQLKADFAFDLANAYADAEASDLRLRLARDIQVLAEQDARIANALVKAGKEPELRAIQANAAVDLAKAAIDEAQAERDGAFAKLTALVDLPAPITSIPESLLDHARADETPPAVDPLASPAYLAARAERDQIARQIRVEQTRARPDMTVSLGVRRIAGEDANVLVGGVSVPIPIFDRNRGNVAAAQSDLLAAEDRMTMVRLEAQANAQSATARLRASFTRVRAAQSNEEAATEAYRLTRIGYEGGKLPQSELVTARRALTEARQLTITAKRERLSAEAALARLQGLTLFGEAS